MAFVPLLVETLICAMARPYSAWKIPLSTLNSCSASIRRQHEVGVEVRVRVFDSVERVMVVADALAGHIERERVARALASGILWRQPAGCRCPAAAPKVEQSVDVGGCLSPHLCGGICQRDRRVAITAPDGSLTAPVIWPVGACAQRLVTNPRNTTQ